MKTTPDRTVTRRLLAAGLFACLVLGGCDKSDSLEAIRQRQATGDYEGTIEPLRGLLAEHPDDPETNYLYGVALAATNRSSLATFALRKAMEDPKWTVVAGLQLAYSALGNADYNEVVDVAGKLLEVEPNNEKALLVRALAHANWRKDPEQALADANRVLELNPDAVEAFEPRILSLLLLDRIDEARDSIGELGRRMDEVDSPESTRAWYCATSAIFAEESGEVEKARETWETCLKEHPSAPEAVWAAIRSLDDQGNAPRAIEVLRAALADAPNTLAYRVALADRLRVAGQAAEGEALLREATRTDDQQIASGAWLELGRYFLRQEQGVAAAEAIERAVEIARGAGPVPPQLQFELADALVLGKKYDRALEVAQELTVPAHRHLIQARVAQERGNPARALEEFDEAFRLWPDNPWARYYAGRAAEDMGDFDRALEEYRSSIRIDPGATEARTRAGRMLIAEGKPRFAAQLLRELSHKPLELAGQLMALNMAGRFGTSEEAEVTFARFVTAEPDHVAEGAAELATGLAAGSRGPAAGLELLRKVNGIDFDDPKDAVALRALVRLSRQAHKAGQMPAELRSALAKHPDSGAFQAIRGLDLELSGSADAAREAYNRALELEPDNVTALAGLGRLTLDSNPEQAVALFDRAIAADPSDPELELAVARALVAGGKPEAAAERLDTMLKEHAFSAEAAAMRASLDLDRGEATPRTLERARRAVRFGGGADALELLGRVYAERGDQEQANEFAERARAMREKPAEGTSKSSKG